MEAYKSGCMICGEELVYLTETESLECRLCGKSHMTTVKCENDHFICDKCHSMDAYALIENFCLHTELQDPFVLASTIMKSDAIKMHGPEHHFIVPAVLVSVYANVRNTDQELKRKLLKKCSERSQMVPGGFCGTHGSCGAAIGAGIFISAITETTPLSVEGWKQSNLITAKALEKIAELGGPRCCKRDSFISIEVAVEFLNEEFGVILPLSDIKCSFSELNRQCKKEQCRFYEK